MAPRTHGESERSRRWRRFHADGAEWEARAVPGSDPVVRHAPRGEGPSDTDAHADANVDSGEGEVVEFVCVDGTRKPRRLALSGAALSEMNDAALRRAYLQARPIGGDHYGRPGKPANDAR